MAINHPFMDGNKRVAIAAAALFLLRNGYRLTADNGELERFTWAVINDRPGLDEVTRWLVGHSGAF